MGTQTVPEYIENTIIPTKYKFSTNNAEVQNGKTEEITQEVKLDDVEDILRHLCKKVVSLTNLKFMVKLFRALIKNLSKEQLDNKYLSDLLTSTVKEVKYP